MNLPVQDLAGALPFYETVPGFCVLSHERHRMTVGSANRVVLRMNSVIPLLIDREAKTGTFAVASAPALFEGKGASGLDLSELSRSGSPGTKSSVTGSRVRIDLFERSDRADILGARSCRPVPDITIRRNV